MTVLPPSVSEPAFPHRSPQHEQPGRRPPLHTNFNAATIYALEKPSPLPPIIPPGQAKNTQLSDFLFGFNNYVPTRKNQTPHSTSASPARPGPPPAACREARRYLRGMCIVSLKRTKTLQPTHHTHNAKKRNALRHPPGAQKSGTKTKERTGHARLHAPPLSRHEENRQTATPVVVSSVSRAGLEGIKATQQASRSQQTGPWSPVRPDAVGRSLCTACRLSLLSHEASLQKTAHPPSFEPCRPRPSADQAGSDFLSYHRMNTTRQPTRSSTAVAAKPGTRRLVASVASS